MKIVVKIKYEDFKFDTPDEALNFAIMACEHSTECDTYCIEMTKEDDSE